MVLDFTGSCALSQLVSEFLNLPLFDVVANNICDGKRNNKHSPQRNVYSMLPSQQSYVDVAENIIKQLKWNNIGVIYQSKARNITLNLFIQTFKLAR